MTRIIDQPKLCLSLVSVIASTIAFTVAKQFHVRGQRRVAPLEMTNHEFLDAKYRKERTTFADGTTVTVDWNPNSFTINPEFKWWQTFVNRREQSRL